VRGRRARWQTRRMPRRSRSMAPTHRCAPAPPCPPAPPAKTSFSTGPCDVEESEALAGTAPHSRQPLPSHQFPVHQHLQSDYIASLASGNDAQTEAGSWESSRLHAPLGSHREISLRRRASVERARFERWGRGSSSSRRSCGQRSMATCTGRSTASRSPPRPSSTERWRHAALSHLTPFPVFSLRVPSSLCARSGSCLHTVVRTVPPPRAEAPDLT